MKKAGAAKRIDPGPNPTDNIVFRQNSPNPGIGTGCTVIAQDKIFAAAQSLFLRLAKGFGLADKVRLVYSKSFGMLGIKNGNVAALDLDCFSRQANNAFNKKLGGVFGKAQDNDVAARRVADNVRQAIDYKVIVIMKIRQHGRTRNHERFGYECPKRDDNYQGNNQNFR